MAKEIEIMIGAEEVVKSIVIKPEVFSDLKPEMIEVEMARSGKNGITRVWKNKTEQYYIEFYNGTALQFDSKEDLESIENVEFVRAPYTSIPHEISFISSISESTFNKLHESGAEEIKMDQLSFFGSFYRIANSEKVLVKWSPYFTKKGYAILESIRTMIGVDRELAHFLDTKGSDSTTSHTAAEEEDRELAFGLENGVHTNAKEFRNVLAEVLNINQDKLDFSVESLSRIDEALMWNADNLNTYYLVLPFTSYVGEILLREKSLQWYKSEAYDYCLLKSDGGQEIDLLRELQKGLVDTDFGLPEVKWVFETVLKEIK
ncbi:MAG: hypothetical protein AAF990_22600 [Bacteroidota bacterium]